MKHSESDAAQRKRHSDECLVRWVLINKTHRQCVAWLNDKPQDQREYFRAMMNEQKANLKQLSKQEQRNVSDGRQTLKQILARKKLAESRA